VSLQNLEVCELTLHLLREFASVASADRNHVELCAADRSYKLLQARKVKKRGRETALLENGGGGDDEEDDDNEPPSQAPRINSSSENNAPDSTME